MSHEMTKSQRWSGAAAPFGMSYGKLLMWFFLISDSLTFFGLLAACGYVSNKYYDSWPESTDVFTHFPFTHAHLPLLYVGFMTLVLILSSITMALSIKAGKRKDKMRVAFWLSLTIIGGCIFLGSQAWEWAMFIIGSEEGAMRSILVDGQWQNVLIHGANLQYNEYGHTLYADFFFTITGFHGFHVFSGIVINIISCIMVIRGVFEKRGHYEWIEKIGLYWYFVDLVWVFVFTFFYVVK